MRENGFFRQTKLMCKLPPPYSFSRSTNESGEVRKVGSEWFVANFGSVQKRGCRKPRQEATFRLSAVKTTVLFRALLHFSGLRRSGLCTIPSGFNKPFLFLPLIFLGTASGSFLRPAASRLLLSRFHPYTIGFPPIKQLLALEAGAFVFGCPRKMG
jgi:hypothetical protein